MSSLKMYCKVPSNFLILILKIFALNVLLFSCNPISKRALCFDRINSADINDIIKTVVTVQPFEVAMTSPVSIKLRRIKIDNMPEENQVPPPPGIYKYQINHLVKSINNTLYFEQKDSIFILCQNSLDSSYTLDSVMYKNVHFTEYSSFDLFQLRREDKLLYDFWEISIPVFSENLNIAFIEVNHFCNRHCSSSYSIKMKKENNKWIIIKNIQNWSS